MAVWTKTVYRGGQGELTEKKSRFIATVCPVKTEEDALAFLERMRKRYWDARHNCYAFVIGAKGELARYSDDGEPGGTAGRPMLEVLNGEGICNAAVVVTRYFGGVLLGTGGLVRAYTQAVKEGLKNSSLGRMCYGYEINVIVDYTGIGKILYLLGNMGIEPVSSDYGEQVLLSLQVPAQLTGELEKNIADATGGKAVFEKKGGIYYIDKE